MSQAKTASELCASFDCLLYFPAGQLRTKSMKFSIVILLSLFIFISHAQIDDWELDSTILTGREIVDDLEIPWEMLYGADDFLYISERQGKVWRIDPDSGNKTLLLDITGRVTQSGTEPGMLGMVFHPDYPQDNRLYIVYNWTDATQKVWERLSSFQVENDSLLNEQVLIDSIPGFRIHNGSRLVIGEDQKIFMTTGDYGQPNVALDTFSLNGKLLRINLDGSIPDDNPIREVMCTRSDIGTHRGSIRRPMVFCTVRNTALTTVMKSTSCIPCAITDGQEWREPVMSRAKWITVSMRML